MGSSINIVKDLSRKPSGIAHVASSTPVCPFAIPEAQTYWNALTVANGGVEVNGSIYGITTCALKGAIDSWFSDMQTQGIYSDFTAAYLYIGATAATHSINAVNPGTFDLTLINGPTCNNLGTIFNGVTQYANTNLNVNTFLTLNNNQFSAITKNQILPGSGFANYLSVKDGIGVGANRIELAITSASNLEGILYKSSPAGCALTSKINAAGAIVDAFSILTREDAANISLYQNGGSVASSVGASCGSLPALNIFIGATNLVGIPSGYYNGVMSFNAIGKAIIAANIVNYTNATLNLMTALGR